MATKQHRRNRHEENGNITLPETSPTKLDTAHGEQKQFLQVIFSRLSQVDPLNYFESVSPIDKKTLLYIIYGIVMDPNLHFC